MARIVVIEDEPSLLRMIAEELVDLGHEVHQAINGEDGLRKIESVRPNVICSDINMPRMNGFQLKQALDARNILDPRTTFIFISAQSSRADVADGLMLGADHYLTKPIDFDRLAGILRGV